MRIAIEGCAHGELEKIYETIQGIEKEQNIKVDLLLCCGDFQSTRNIDDLQTMAVPKKYQNMGSFYKYYSGELLAPMLTLFIGGNHEASNYLQELPYGGWVAPNIYYLGYAGVVRVNGIRIAGISGIYKPYDYMTGRHEFSPYTKSTITSVYHVRQLEVFRLKQLSGKLDIFMSHDWPRGICDYGNKAQLLRFKSHFTEDVENNKLGSKPSEELLKELKPTYWFAAHLHCKFSALVPHDVEENEEDSSKTVAVAETKFLALDKCLPKRRFLQLLDIPGAESKGDCELRLEYDLEWLAILNLTNHLISVKTSKYYVPGIIDNDSSERTDFTPTSDELEKVRAKFPNLEIPKNFCRTVEPYDGITNFKSCGHVPHPKPQLNPQSIDFCDKLGIDDPLSLAMLINGHELSTLNESSFSNAEQSSFNTTDCSNVSLNQSTPFKRKSWLNLPKPTYMDSPIVSNDGSDDAGHHTTNPDEMLLTESDIDDNIEDGAASATVDPANEVATNTPPIKKLRRRNQDMYNENDEHTDTSTIET